MLKRNLFLPLFFVAGLFMQMQSVFALCADYTGVDGAPAGADLQSVRHNQQYINNIKGTDYKSAPA